MKSFFKESELLDYLVTRPLSHIRPNWELAWDSGSEEYSDEEDSFAAMLNGLVGELEQIEPPAHYHDSEDRLAEYVRDGPLKWPIRKVGRRWVGADYEAILEQGAFQDIDQVELTNAASGRIKAAKDRGQAGFDDMEESHRRMLGAVLTIILYHRTG